MSERHKPAPVSQQVVELIEVEPSFRRHGQEPQDDAAPLGEHLPRHQVAVVLENRKQDLVAGLEEMAE